MTLYRTNGGIARSANGAMGRCCCDGDQQCYFTSDAEECGHPGSGKWVPREACLRVCIWKNVRWNESLNYFTSGGVPITGFSGWSPDWTLRQAFRCTGRGTPVIRHEEMPVVSRCWDYNPISGTGDFPARDCLPMINASDDYFAWALNPVYGTGKPKENQRFALGIRTAVWIWGNWDRTRPSGFRWVYGGTAKIHYEITAYPLTKEEADEWDSATLSATCS
jgi:hypothetical protein